MSLLDAKKKGLNRRLGALMEEYAAANEQWMQSVSEVDRVRIDKQLKAIEKKWKGIEEELNQLKSLSHNTNRRHLDIQDKLPRIDFKEAVTIIKNILEPEKSIPNAAIFLLQNSHSMGGRWCVARIKELLNDYTNNLRHYQIEFSAEGQLDEFGLLHRLARHLNITPGTEDLQQYTRTVIYKICDSLVSGSIVLLEIRRWDYVHPQERVLSWLIDDFWKPLVAALSEVLKVRRKIKLVMMLMADSTINEAFYCRAAGEFHSGKILELPLSNWTRDEIKDWLESYSGLGGPPIDRMTDLIFHASNNGIPTLVHTALLEHLLKESENESSI